MPRLRLPDPQPYTGAGRCPACDGKKITGDRYEMPGDTAIIVVDQLCPTCHGCGRAEHHICQPAEHGAPEVLGLDDFDEFDEEDDDAEEDLAAGICYSCQERRWFAVQAFPPDEDAEQMIYLRTPCGCAADMLVAA